MKKLIFVSSILISGCSSNEAFETKDLGQFPNGSVLFYEAFKSGLESYDIHYKMRLEKDTLLIFTSKINAVTFTGNDIKIEKSSDTVEAISMWPVEIKNPNAFGYYFKIIEAQKSGL